MYRQTRVIYPTAVFPQKEDIYIFSRNRKKTVTDKKNCTAEGERGHHVKQLPWDTKYYVF